MTTKTSDGGPTNYYDFSENWVTLNDVIESKAENQWKEYSWHLGNIFKAVFRWGVKDTATRTYDTKKIIYSGLRLLVQLEGHAKVDEYLTKLSNDPQFQSYR